MDEESVKQPPEIVKFKNVKEFQMVKDGPPAMTFSKTSYGETHELMYKVLKADVKLV